jgi:uncharacterized protein YwqG
MMDRETLIEQIREANLTCFEDAALADRVDDLAPLIKPAIRAIPEAVDDEDEIPLGASKLGGRPDLPVGRRWPVVDDVLLQFMGQFRLSEAATLDESGLLPDEGLLYFFFDGLLTGYLEGDFRDRCRVLYSKAPVDDLRRVGAPRHPESQAFHLFAPCRVTFEKTLTLPPSVELTSDILPPVYPVDFRNDAQIMTYQDLRRMLWDPGTQFLGHVIEMQAEEEKVMALQKKTPGRYVYQDDSITNKAELQQRLSELVLLFTAASEPEAEMNWGDGGLVYFWIEQADLENGNWDAVWASLASG